MAITTWSVRLFGGRNIGVTYDDSAGTLTILNQSLSMSSLSATLQAEWATAVQTTPRYGGVAPFGGSNVQSAVGDILDATPTWRTAVQSALAIFVAQQTANGSRPDADEWRY